MASYFITGASRGLGLGLTSLLATKPLSEVTVIFAAARNISQRLQSTIDKSCGRIIYIPLEVTDEKMIKDAVVTVENAVGDKGLDVLVNNAGIADYIPEGMEKMDNLMHIMDVNVNGVHMITREFLPLLRKGQQKKIVNLSTSMSSIGKAEDYFHQPTPAYKISKAALNMLTRQYALTLADEGFTIFAISPGWVKTDMGTGAADLTVEVASNALMTMILQTTKTDNGKFLDTYVQGWKESRGFKTYDGSPIPY